MLLDRRVLLATLFLLLGARAWAQDAGKPAGVTYGTLDAATFRVFAVGTVGVRTVQGPGVAVEVASPQSGHGTGFAVTPELVVTAQHVVAGARHIVIRLPGDGGFLPARVAFASKDDDIAILHVSAALTPIRLHTDQRALRVRENVFAVGYPLDASRTQAQSARGIIAGHRPDASLQLDISLNPGNSGGPLVDDSERVIGMVIARGDVEQGVQGMGIAVPAGKLRSAVAEAQRTVSAGHVAPISEREKMSAEVVDELVRQGTLHSVREHDDLKKSLERHDIEQQIDRLAARLADADLLVFVGGTLWNAALAIELGGVRKIGDRTLTEPEAHAFARDLHTAAIRLTRRGTEIDATVGTRSSFVAVAMQREHSIDAVAEHPSTAGRARWTLQVYPHLRTSGGWGWGVEAKRQRGGRLFWSVGLSTGGVSLTASDNASLTHRFYAVELGAGIRFPLATTAHVEIVGGLAPSYYSASAEDGSGMTTTKSGLVPDHLRATASLAFERWYISSGIRLIGATAWLELIGLGINF